MRKSRYQVSSGPRGPIVLILSLIIVALGGLLIRDPISAPTLIGNNVVSVAAAYISPPEANGIAVGRSMMNSLSRPLREITPVPMLVDIDSQDSDKENGTTEGVLEGTIQGNALVQQSFAPLTMPTPITNWDGLAYMGLAWTARPPDTTGEAGLSHYVQAVNSSFQVWTKQGDPLYGPVTFQSLWANTSSPCGTLVSRDLFLLYDQLADRWWINSHISDNSGNFYVCAALSQTYDPTGAWYLYTFPFSGSIDYEKVGVWPDGYYMSTNRGSAYTPVVFNRAKMLAGLPADFQTQTNVSYRAIIPADLDGSTLPVDGTPNYFIGSRYNGNLTIYKFHVDWQTPSLSFFTPWANLPVQNYSTCISCIEQPDTTQILFNNDDRIMPRLAYRRFVDHDALVLNYSISVGGQPSRTGIRWSEIRNPGTTPTMYQESTYAPADGASRWMGSIAMDRVGDLALGYSVSSNTIYPSIRYAGRTVTAPLNELDGDGSILEGTGSQLGHEGWGDYSGMTIDPVDDCTFWYTTEYNRSYSVYWRTQIASFKFPGCTPQPTRTPTATPTGTPPTATPTRTNTATPTRTSTPTVCTLQFADVSTADTFYPYIQCLSCRGIITGYPCGGVGEPCNANNDPYFRPGNPVTRGQLAKMISLSKGYDEVLAQLGIQSFSDVPDTDPFWIYVERSLLHEVVAGYPCGAISEPCDSVSHRYFRTGVDAGRGQLAKMVSIAAEFNDAIPPTRQTYEDVAPDSTFWVYIERLSWRGMISGYPCGGVGEPCVPPGNRPYFRPSIIATRAQTAKIVAMAFFPQCTPPNNSGINGPEKPDVTAQPTGTTAMPSVTPSVPVPVPSVPMPVPSVPPPAPTGVATVIPPSP